MKYPHWEYLIQGRPGDMHHSTRIACEAHSWSSNTKDLVMSYFFVSPFSGWPIPGRIYIWQGDVRDHVKLPASWILA